jgi:hypothetical protein
MDCDPDEGGRQADHDFDETHADQLPHRGSPPKFDRRSVAGESFEKINANTG